MNRWLEGVIAAALFLLVVRPGKKTSRLFFEGDKLMELRADGTVQPYDPETFNK
jgi:hypothetical protein